MSDDGGWEEDDLEQTRVTSGPVVSSAAGLGGRSAYVITITGPDSGRIHKLDGAHTFGRSVRADVRLDDDSISRFHVKFSCVGENVVVEDLRSANGTFVNGERIEMRKLKDGDKIRIGETTILKFSIQDKLDEQFQNQLYRAALHDDLTGAFNKKYLMQQLNKEFRFAVRHRAPLSLIMFDIDHFKKFNDTYGHVAGDQILKQLSERVSEGLRSEDLFARYGGEEFAILARGINGRGGALLGERLCLTIASHGFPVASQALKVTISVGVAELRHDDMTHPVALIEAADAALYRAKHGGRNRVVLQTY